MPDNGAEKLRNAAGALSAVADLLNEAANDFEENIKTLKGLIIWNSKWQKTMPSETL